MSIVKLRVEGDDGGSEDDALFALRGRAAEALERAFGFLEREATRVELDRARVLMGVDPVDAWVAGWAEGQTEDGALPEHGLFAGGAVGGPDLEGQTPPDELRGTLESLIVLADAGALESPCVEPAALRLLRIQNADGSFGPGDTPEPMRLFVTGLLAGILGESKTVRPDLLVAAGEWLGPRFSPEAVENGRWSAITAFGTFFSNVAHERSDEALQWCGRELERGYRSGRFDAALTVRALLHCDALAMPGASFDPVELLDHLLGEQAGDGGFAELAAGGRRVRITPTVDAIHSIVSLCKRF
jgi:hypothetical protein